MGLFLGIATGLFVGEPAAVLQPVGDAFVQLLKMAVLPYIMVSLMTGLGRLSHAEVRVLGVRVGGILLLIWAVTFLTVSVVPLTFPELQSASFFSTTLLEVPQPFDFLQFIPANPFKSMANNIVPAVVLFSIAVGVALMGVENKNTLIDTLEVFGEALTRVMHFVTRLTPIGVYAIAASSAGTMRLEELDRLQVYVIAYIVISLALTFFVLPALVTSLTPLRYRDILSRTKDALVTAFATDSLLVVLPMLSEQGKALVREAGSTEEGSDSVVDVIVPASFNFPNVGKLLQLSFVLFAAWFTDVAVTLAGYAKLYVAGLFGFFGKPVAAMPFLLDLMRIPADMFQLYMASGILVARFGTLASTMQTFVIAVLGALAVAGLLRIRVRSLVTAAFLTVAWLAVFVVGGRAYFQYALEGAYDKDQIIAQMQLMSAGPSAVVHDVLPPSPDPDPSRPTLERIRLRGFIRVGHVPGSLPYAFFNGKGEMVGFDAAMAHDLARELGVDLEFVPVAPEEYASALDEGRVDILMSAIVVSPQRVETMGQSTPYMDMTLAFLVNDHLREDFGSREAIQKLEAPRIGVFDFLPYFVEIVKQIAPNAVLVPVQTPEEFLDDTEDRFDALEFTAEMGSAYSLLYPQFSVAIPHPDVVKLPLTYPVRLGDDRMLSYINTWVDLKKKDGTIRRYYDHWILGKDANPREPRWSVMRDVLHWVN